MKARRSGMMSRASTVIRRAVDPPIYISHIWTLEYIWQEADKLSDAELIKAGCGPKTLAFIRRHGEP